MKLKYIFWRKKKSTNNEKKKILTDRWGVFVYNDENDETRTLKKNHLTVGNDTKKLWFIEKENNDIVKKIIEEVYLKFEI